MLSGSLQSGHTRNIFALKFMPHSNGRSLASAAGDSQVRVFDLEYGANHNSCSLAASRLYQAHCDRVKRIVTDDSPFVFMTCSEDGDVRQFDMRQPSQPHFSASNPIAVWPGTNHNSSDNLSNSPPPLISYRRYGVQLDALSCSPSKPQYIALGGTHNHCFLHDRRMVGRDMDGERGRPSKASVPTPGTSEDANMSTNTRCVRRFAPPDKPEERRHDGRHITGCKISDHNPNELLVSWTSDHIYSFDMLSETESRDDGVNGESIVSRNKSSHGRSRNNSNDFIARRNRRRSAVMPPTTVMASTDNVEVPIASGIAARVARVRRLLLFKDATSPRGSQTSQECFNSALTNASAALKAADRSIIDWQFPNFASPRQSQILELMDQARISARRFIQAAGTLARALGGQVVSNPSNGDYSFQPTTPEETTRYFSEVAPTPCEDGSIDCKSRFCYNFLKAIALWMEGGREALVRGFTDNQSFEDRQVLPYWLPIPAGASECAIEDILIPYLTLNADNHNVINVDVSIFEREAHRVIFATTKDAVQAFSRAIRVPFGETGHGRSPLVPPGTDIPAAVQNGLTMDRNECREFWALKVGRSILRQAATADRYERVYQAFSATWPNEPNADDVAEQRQHDVGVELVDALDIREVDGDGIFDDNDDNNQSNDNNDNDDDDDDDNNYDIDNDYDDGDDDYNYDFEGIDDDDGFSYTEYDHNDWENDSSELELRTQDRDPNGVNIEMGHASDDPFNPNYVVRRRRSTTTTTTSRSESPYIHPRTPLCSLFRTYSGHANIQSKDVNFIGLRDEYVASGSDTGHIFIWDKKTGELVNLLIGDTEAVNVIEPHPYEPLIATAGIDNTVKIFSSDARERLKGRHDYRSRTTISGGGIISPFTRGTPVDPALEEDHTDGNNNNNNNNHDNDDTVSDMSDDNDVDPALAPRSRLRSCRRMHDSYRILSENDRVRRTGFDPATAMNSLIALHPLGHRIGVSFSEWLSWF